MTVSVSRDVPARVFLSTPPGSGGIVVIVVRGEQALRTVGSVFRPKKKNEWFIAAPESLHYGHMVDGDDVIDEVIVRIARSSGRHEVVEVNCHGGAVAAAEVMRLLIKTGAVETPPFDIVDPQLDRIQSEALRLLRLAATQLAARVLCDQLNGALSDAIRALDPADGSAAERLAALIESASFGMALTRPRRIALIGRPNVGKSALFNALIGRDRAIVSPVPGTTRDFIDELLVLDGYPIELVDTAGLRRRGGLVEMKGVAATWRVVSDADLLIFVIDRSIGLHPSERGIIEHLEQRDMVFAANKSDLPAKQGWRPPNGDCFEVSARTGDGLAELRRAILRRFPPPAAYPPGTPVAFTATQLQALTEAKELVDAGRSEEARQKLMAMLLNKAPAAHAEGTATVHEGACPGTG